MRIAWNPQGFYDLRRSTGIVNDLERRGRNVAAACGEGYAIVSYQGKKVKQGRWQVQVVATNAKAWVDNRRNNTLVRNLFSAGRG